MRNVGEHLNYSEMDVESMLTDLDQKEKGSFLHCVAALR